MWKRLIYKNIIYIEGMFGKLQSTLAQQFCPVNNRMHQDILSCHKELNILPGKYLIPWESSMVIHHLFPLCSLFLINKVSYQHIKGFLTVYKPSQSF